MGQLGLGHRRSTMEFTLLESLEQTSIKKVSTGHHTAAISTKGELFFWGTSVFGEILSPQRIDLKIEARDVAVGGTFGIVLDADERVWAWGANTSGELATGDFEPKPSPHQLLKLQHKGIKSVVCGKAFGIALGKSTESIKRQKFATGHFPLVENTFKEDKSSRTEDLSEIDIKESAIPSWRNDTILNMSKCLPEDTSCSISQRDPNQNLIIVLTRQRDYLEETLKRENKEKNRLSVTNAVLKEELTRVKEELNKSVEKYNKKLEEANGRIAELKAGSEILNKMVKEKELQLNEVTIKSDKIKKKYETLREKFKTHTNIEKSSIKRMKYFSPKSNPWNMRRKRISNWIPHVFIGIMIQR